MRKFLSHLAPYRESYHIMPCAYPEDPWLETKGIIIVKVPNLQPFLTQLFSSTSHFRSCPSPRSLPTYLQELGGFSHEDSLIGTSKSSAWLAFQLWLIPSVGAIVRTMMLRSRPNKTNQSISLMAETMQGVHSYHPNTAWWRWMACTWMPAFLHHLASDTFGLLQQSTKSFRFPTALLELS